MDIDLLESLATVDWPAVRRAADLGLRHRAHRAVAARQGGRGDRRRRPDAGDARGGALTGVYERLLEADVTATGLEPETVRPGRHVPRRRAPAGPRRRSTRRPTASRRPRPPTCSSGSTRTSSWPPGCRPTSTAPTGEPVAIETHVHLLSEHLPPVSPPAGTLVEMKERLIDDGWLALKPKWSSLRGQPIAFAVAWRRLDRP